MNRNPIYNLKAVLKDTGLKPDVLRAWERRYGLPNPERTEGGHRLYSEYDVAILKWLIQRQGEGLSISHAVKKLQEELSSGLDPLNVNLVSSYENPNAAFENQGENSLAALRNAWLKACFSYNEVQAEGYLNQAFALYSVETVCLKVLQQGIAEVGYSWLGGEATVQQEHYASAMALRRLNSLMLATPAPNRPHTILICCPSDEWHAFTPLLIALFLRRKGFNVIYLGPNVPSNRFQETIDQIKPSLVILSAQQLTSAAALHKLSLTLQECNASVCYGGRIFNIQPNLREYIAGEFLGESIEIALANVERLVSTAHTIFIHRRPSEEQLDTLEHFLKNRHRIDAIISVNIRSVSQISYENLDIANRFMGDNLVASLELGSLSYLYGEIEWLRVLLKNQKLPENIIPDYFRMYSSAVEETMREHGQIIRHWIETQVLNQ